MQVLVDRNLTCMRTTSMVEPYSGKLNLKLSTRVMVDTAALACHWS